MDSNHSIQKSIQIPATILLYREYQISRENETIADYQNIIQEFKIKKEIKFFNLTSLVAGGGLEYLTFNIVYQIITSQSI